MQLKRISLSKVLKLELPLLINEVIRIVEKHNPESLGLRSMHKLLLKDQEQMKLLKMRASANPLTKTIKELRENECKYVGAIVSHIQFTERADIESIRSATMIAIPVVNRFLPGFRKNNESVINETTHQFLKHLDEHPEVYDALSELGLRPFVDEMRKVNMQKIELTAKRDEYILKGNTEADSKTIQKEAQNNLDIMFSTIELYNGDDDKPSFDPLIGELNILLTRYATIINTRKTHNKNKWASKVIKGGKSSLRDGSDDK